ncbi:LLM class flavin-dependent oxidoreductase [Streptomyces marispadix]|uniref:LLM class flavin-dependent oxidoreductase n=1 Tax=Streptomyces marispadix TaxID=2922868 RepID=A0ABS9T2J1_9ACTN|nr:LLM class flavin-dependent oxidoreductase [Streptomyces marispadix]MCH6162668.1 LLM class flavin-dependent oxidoreductase [Streptomyces marispadix]
MRVGAFVLAAQFPGQGQAEPLHRAVRTAETAEAAGLDSVWLAEHHFVPYGVCPSAVTLAALLLGRTRRIGVGTAVSVLPNAHPVALGEQSALLHLTSGGRFTLGVGRGGPWVDLEVLGGGLDAYEHGFPESLDLLLRWLREKRVGADGERYRFREVDVVPRCDETFTPARGGAGSNSPLWDAGSGTGPQRARSGTDGTETAPAGRTAGEATPSADISTADDSHVDASHVDASHADASADHPAKGPAVVVACTSPGSVRLAARRCLPMLLGMHCGDEEKAEAVTMWRREARDAGHDPDEIARAASLHVSAGVAQVADTTAEAVESLTKSMPGWFREGLGAHRTVDDRARTMRDPVAYTELLCSLHPVGTPRLCADRLAATHERTGIGRFALLVEGTGDLAATERNVQRLGEEVVASLPPGP